MFCECDICKILKVFSIIIILSIIIIIVITIINTNNEEKNILSTIAVEGDNMQIGTALINFSENRILVGNALSHEEGSNSININESGIYQISYQLHGISEVLGTFNFNAVLLVNDVVLDDTLNESPILRENVANRMTLTSTVILRLESGDNLKLGALTIEDIGYDRARMDIEKID